MTADDVIAGARGKPQPFTFFGFEYLLRPLTRSEVLGLRDSPDETGLVVQARIVALAVCNEDGVPIFTEEQIPSLPHAAIDAIADEVARRNWLPPEGKGDSVKTTA